MYGVIAYIKQIITILGFFRGRGKLKWPSRFAIKENTCKGRGNSVTTQLCLGSLKYSFMILKGHAAITLQLQPQQKWELRSFKFSQSLRSLFLSTYFHLSPFSLDFIFLNREHERADPFWNTVLLSGEKKEAT